MHFWPAYIGSCAGHVTYRKMAVRAESAKGARKLVFCGHCGDYVAKRTFYQHKRLYFDTKLKEWKQMRVYNSVDMESEVFAIPDRHSRRSSSPESLASGRDVSDEVNEGTGRM